MLLKTLKRKLLYDPEIPRLGIRPEKMTIQKDTFTNVHSNTVSSIQEAT